MAHTKSGGSAKSLRDSKPKYLGIKLSHGQSAKPGAILVRQRGTKVIAGKNVRVGKDHTLFATAAGTVAYRTRRKTRYDGTIRRVVSASVE